MLAPIPISLGLALAIATVAAVYDGRSGTIPNWLTLPPVLFAPPTYALVLGLEYGVQSVAAVLASGIAPYLLFRRRAVGGGDVKLFAALGAVTGFDPLLGVRIQLGAFLAAMLVAFAGLAWQGKLLSTVLSAGAMSLNRLLPASRRLRVSDSLLTPVRMGSAVLLATIGSALAYATPLWSGR